MNDWKEIIAEKVKNRKKPVTKIDLDKNTVWYADKIKKPKIEHLKPEEFVRSFLADKLVHELGYTDINIELEKEYIRESIGRDKAKKDSARVDLIVWDKLGNPFIFCEIKAPEEFENGQSDIKGQLFELSDLEEKQNKTKVNYLVYYSIEESDDLIDRLYLIDKTIYKDYDNWFENKEKTLNIEIPYNFGKPKLKVRIKDKEDSNLSSISENRMTRLRSKLHDTLWSNGAENEAYEFLVKYLLTKIYDEEITLYDNPYDCQIFEKDYNDQLNFFNRINLRYKDALKEKLHYIEDDFKKIGDIITHDKIDIQTLYFIVQELQEFSFSKSILINKKDILGLFFEETNREKFKQSKGQFFTPTNIVDFIIYALKIDQLAIHKFNKDFTLPFIVDPSAGSGTFLIESMKIITKEFKKSDFELSGKKEKSLKKLFPKEKPNDWAEKYIYGIDNNYQLTISTKVNMILHGDGSSNTFKDDALKSLQSYAIYKNSKLAEYDSENIVYSKKKGNLAVNEQFDIILSNPPFSVTINEDKENVNKYFMFGDKKNSENLFIERYYQLLKEGGRLGVVLPESVYDTTENKYIRLFLFKYFNIKAVVSLPQITFEPYTSTKTSLLFAQKKTKSEIEEWNALWDKYGREWAKLRTRVTRYFDFFVNNTPLNKRLAWVKELSEDSLKKISKESDNEAINHISKDDKQNILENIYRYLKDYILPEDKELDITALLEKYSDEIVALSSFEKETYAFGFYNAWWVFGEVAKELDYQIFMAEAENVGYKRTKRGENPMPNDLFDFEFAPGKLNCNAILNRYDERIKQVEENKINAEKDKKELEEKNGTKENKINLQRISKLNDEIERLTHLIESLNNEKLEVSDLLLQYYQNDRLKDEYLERTDEELISHFKSGLLSKYKSDDVLLRNSEKIKILDAVRQEVVWE